MQRESSTLGIVSLSSERDSSADCSVNHDIAKRIAIKSGLKVVKPSRPRGWEDQILDL